MNKRLVFALAASALLSFTLACDRLFTVTGPSPITNSGFSTLPAWSPCVVVHVPGREGDPAMENQMAAVAKLQQAGRMTWIRLGSSNPKDYGNGLFEGRDYFIRAKSMGLKVFGIIHLHDLETYGWENAFDSIYRQYPADIWEIAGEISNGDPSVNPLGTTTPEIFMPKFRRLYEHVRRNYQGVALTSPATFGSGSDGAAELERFIELGMLDMDIIIAVNVYTEHALSRYASSFAKYGSQLAHKRIWVTETGISDPDRQIEWVEYFYPKLVQTFNPEMICYYALWVGDNPGDHNPFGMITNVENGQQLVERPLFKALTGGR